MSSGSETTVDTMYELLKEQKFQFEEAAKCCVEAIHGMNVRLERLEQWMTNQERIAQ